MEQPTRPRRILVVDDEPFVLKVLVRQLSQLGYEEILSYEHAQDALEVLQRDDHQVDVVFTDLQMPGMDGVEATRRIVEEDLGAEVVVLTSYSDNTRIVAALDAGAVGYLLKDAEPEEVLRGIRAVARGESPINPRAARELLGARRTANASAVELTPRETEVLGLVRQGLANKQIARRLGISERTVKAHLTSTFQRIGVMDRTQAALWAERNGIA